MEIDPFGFIEDSCRIPKVQESILREFPFPRKDGRWESLSSQEPPCGFTLEESTGIVMVSLPETEDEVEEEEGRVGGSGVREEEEEEYHTPPENTSAVPSSDEAAGAAAEAAERVVDLARDDEADISQDVLGFGKGGEADRLIVLERKLEKIRALRRKEGSPGSLRSKLRIALGLAESCLELYGGNLRDLGRDSDSGVLESGFDSSRASNWKNVLDECLQEYLAKKLKKAEKKLGIVSGNEHHDDLDDGSVEVDREMREIRISKGGNVSGGSRRDYLSRRLRSLEKARDDNVSGASGGESVGRLKRTTVDDSVKRLKSLENSGNRDMVKDVVYGNSEAVDLDDGMKESPVKKMKVLEVNLQVETPSGSVGIVKKKIRELLKSMEKLNPQEGMAEGSSMRRKLNKNSDREDTIRIIDLEVSERHDGPVADRDGENAASCGEAFAGNERSKNLAQKKSIEEIEKFRYTGKSFHPHNKGKRKCSDEGSGMINGEVDEFELCDNLARKISKSREGIGARRTDVLGESSKDAQGLRKLPPSIEGQSTDKESRKGYQSQAAPPQPYAPPQEDEPVDLAPSKSDAPLPPKVKVPDVLKVMKMITGARMDTNDGTESLIDVAKRLAMNLPRPRWWPERNFELG